MQVDKNWTLVLWAALQKLLLESLHIMLIHIFKETGYFLSQRKMKCQWSKTGRCKPNSNEISTYQSLHYARKTPLPKDTAVFPGTAELLLKIIPRKVNRRKNIWCVTQEPLLHGACFWVLLSFPVCIMSFSVWFLMLSKRIWTHCCLQVYPSLWWFLSSTYFSVFFSEEKYPCLKAKQLPLQKC